MEMTMALQIRPNCEYCDKDLPPNATDACICSYECTFCADCVETKLHNVCPNCGGGFAQAGALPCEAAALQHQRGPVSQPSGTRSPYAADQGHSARRPLTVSIERIATAPHQLAIYYSGMPALRSPSVSRWYCCW